MTSEDKQTSRALSMIQDARSDFKVAIVLLIIALFLFFHTLTFPMSGSYAGVENQWFVSPALFPLIIISLLILLSSILLFKATRQKGFEQFTQLKSWLGDWQDPQVVNRWYIIWSLVVFVYVYVPSIDFYLAAVLFLVALTSRFYYEFNQSLLRISLIHLLLSLCLIGIKLFINATEDTTWLSVNQDTLVIYYSDLIASATIAILLGMIWFTPVNKNNKRAITQTAVVLVMPLFLSLIFTFLLFVPMPVEYGSVSNFFSYLIYEVLAI
jgi:hypothetical protein